MAGDAAHGAFGVASGEVVAAEVVIVDVLGEDVPGGDQDRVLDRDRFLIAQAGRETQIAGAEVGPFTRTPSGHRGGAEGAAEPPVAVSAFT